MKRSPMMTSLAAAATVAMLLGGCTSSPSEEGSKTPAASGDENSYSTEDLTDGKTAFVRVTNPNGGKTLTYAKDSGFTLLEEKDGDYTYAFKDMNGNGSLDKWEDWRVDAGERAADLAPQLTVEQAAGLMLFSSHERAPGDGLTDAQKDYLENSNLRTVLHAGSSEVEPSVTWANEMQAFVEGLATEEKPYVPVSLSSDPRSDAKDSYDASGGVSQWPSTLGLAATFDEDTVSAFAKIASTEYRALGISNALSPQIDMATEPRWLRNNGTWGEDPDMTAKYAQLYVEGFQNTYDADGNPIGWGDGSVATMIKHFPGDGRGEGGRESHTNVGKYAVAAGGDLEDHLKPFEASMESAGLMTSYSILVDAEGNPAYGDKLVGTAYNTDLLDVLRKDMGYEGVIVTDWGVLNGGSTDPDAMIGTAWGMDDVEVPVRIFEVLKNGIDSLGGFNNVGPVMEAHDLWQKAYEAGEVSVDADTRFRESGERVIHMLMLGGLYENPYTDLEASLATVGSDEFMKAGYDAQLESIVVAKNSGAISCDAEQSWEGKKVYIPNTYNKGFDGLFGPASLVEGPSLSVEAAEAIFGAGNVVTDTPELDAEGNVVSYTTPDLADVDVVLVGMDSPDNGSPFTQAGFDQETQSYYPLSLQYRPYTADGPNVRTTSIGGDTLADGSKENRSYFGATSKIANEADLDAFERAVAAVEASGKDIPVIVALNAKNPVIPAEFEGKADAIVIGMGVSDSAMIEVALGLHESTGRLPQTYPANMDTVEANKEDVPFDLEAYVDSVGNAWEYGFGLSCDATPIK